MGDDDMSKRITYLVTFIILCILLPIGIYMFYFNYQDGLYSTLEEFASYTTSDKTYDIKVMKYIGVGDGEESYTLKTYVVNNDTNEVVFINTNRISAYGTEVTFSEDNTLPNDKYVTVMISSSSGKTIMTQIDTLNGLIRGKKLRGNII